MNTIIELNGRKYKAVLAETTEMAQTNCEGCAFMKSCKRNKEKAIVPSFCGVAICSVISCIWKEIKED